MTKNVAALGVPERDPQKFRVDHRRTEPSLQYVFGTGVKSEPDNKRLKDALDISSWSGCAVRIAQTVVKAGNPANPCGIDARDQFVGGFSMWLPRDSCQQLSGPPVVSM